MWYCGYHAEMEMTDDEKQLFLLVFFYIAFRTKFSDNMKMNNKEFIDIDFHVQKGAMLGYNWHGASDMIVDLKINDWK